MTDKPRWLALIAITVGILVQPLNSTMIVIALPRIASQLNVEPSLAAWLITAYLLATVISQPTLGKLGDRVGHRRMFMIGSTVFGVASLAASVAWIFPLLIVCRVLQAVAGAALLPSGAALLRDLYASHERGRAFGVYGAALSVTAATGPVLGGALVGLADWPAIFIVSVPVCALAIALTWYAVPMQLRDLPIANRRFDAWGALTLGVTLLGLLLALLLGPREGWTSATVLACAVVALIFAALFFAQERRHPEPVVNLRFFRNRTFTAAVLSVFSQNMVTYSTLILMPLFLQSVQRRSAADSGLMLASQSATSALLAPIGGTLSDRLGRRWPVVIGTVFLLLGALMQTVLQLDTPLLWITGGLMAMGIGSGLSGASVQTSALEAVPAEMAGVAAGLHSTMRYLGSTLGSALIGIALAGEANSAAGFDRAFTGLSVIACGAVAVAWGLPTGRQKGSR